MEKVFLIAPEFFITTSEKHDNGFLPSKFSISGNVLYGAVVFKEESVQRGDGRTVIVNVQISGSPAPLPVETLNEITSVIVNNHSGIANVMGGAYLAKFFDGEV